MKINEIVKTVYDSHLKEDDYFDSAIFFYLAGRFPDLTIKQCTEVVEQIRDNLLN